MSTVYIHEESDKRFDEILSGLLTALPDEKRPQIVRLRSDSALGGEGAGEGFSYPVPFTRYRPQEDGSYASAHQAAGAVREMIQYNYMKPDTAQNYASRVHMSLTHLCRAFRKETGKSIGHYITHVRMQRAADYLVHSNVMIKEIARAVGYPNTPYFCKVFKQYYNMSPAAYRKANRHSFFTSSDEKDSQAN